MGQTGSRREEEVSYNAVCGKGGGLFDGGHRDGVILETCIPTTREASFGQRATIGCGRLDRAGADAAEGRFSLEARSGTGA